MATILGLYNEALTLLGERHLSSLTNDIESRYLLDNAWDQGLVARLAEDNDWVFLRQSVKISYDNEIETEFGYKKGHTKPTDLLKVSGIYSDEYMRSPLSQYEEGDTHWFTDLDDIYVQYVKNTVINDIASWPEYFSALVAVTLALRVSPTMKNLSDQQRIEQEWNKVERQAKSKDAMRHPTKPLPRGSWNSARLRNGSYNGRPGDY